MKGYSRLLLPLAIIFFSSFVLALSCDKKNSADVNITRVVDNITNVTEVVTGATNTTETNITNTNVKNLRKTVTREFFGGLTPRVPKPAGLENFVITVNKELALLEGGAIYINAKALANAYGPSISSGNARDRGVADVAWVDGGGRWTAPGDIVPTIFTVSIKNSVGGIMLVQPYSVTRNTLAYHNDTKTTGVTSEMEIAPVATDTYRTYNFLRGWGPYIWNAFGDFKNTDANAAQGVFYCRAYLTVIGFWNQSGALNGGQTMTCKFASVNNAVNAAAEVDEAWVNSDTSTTELDVKLFGIDTGNKTIPNLGAPSITSGTRFSRPVPNAVMQQIMNANTYYESELKIRIVTEANYKRY